MTLAQTLIKNLAEIAKQHKEDCKDEHCEVSTFLVRQAAVIIANNKCLGHEDYEVCLKMINEIPL